MGWGGTQHNVMCLPSSGLAAVLLSHLPTRVGPILPRRRAEAVSGLPVCAVPCLAQVKNSLPASLVMEPVGSRPGTGTPE